MSDVVDLAFKRQRRIEADSDCLTVDPDGRPMQVYALDAQIDEERHLAWMIEAYSPEDAEAKVAAIRASLMIVGQVVARGEL